MGLLERARYLLLERCHPPEGGDAEPEGVRDVLGSMILDLVDCRLSLASWRQALLTEAGRLDREADDAQREILELEKRIRGALEAEDEVGAREAIGKKRNIVSVRASLEDRAEGMRRQLRDLDRSLEDVEARIGLLRRERAAC